MTDVTSYLMNLDQTALGLCFVAALGVIGCLAVGAMRTDIARARPEPAPIDRVMSVIRSATDAVSRHGALRQPQSL